MRFILSVLALLLGLVPVFTPSAPPASAHSGVWTKQSIGTLRGVSFVDANNGWVVGDDGVILRTADGGETWSR